MLKKQWLSALVLVVSGALVFGCTQPYAANATASPVPVASATVTVAGAVANVTIHVNVSGLNVPLVEDVSVRNGSSALTALKAAGATVDLIQYPFGAYVRGVNNVTENANGNGRYWRYYIDNTLAPVAMDQYALTHDAALDVRYETPDLKEMSALNASGAPTVAPTQNAS